MHSFFRGSEAEGAGYGVLDLGLGWSGVRVQGKGVYYRGLKN